MATTLIKNGRIVTAVDDYTADIVVVDGRIETIGKNIAAGGDGKVHDANGLLVLPRGGDVHTHLDLEVRPTRPVDSVENRAQAGAVRRNTTPIHFFEPPPPALGSSRGRPRIGRFASRNWPARRSTSCTCRRGKRCRR